MDFKGDINNDGKIDELDAQICSANIAGLLKLSEAEIARADVNNDGRVTVSDVKAILNHINCKELIDEVIY